jgi:hypothetical protein
LSGANQPCRHEQRRDQVCTVCGHCEHDVVLNGACFYCGATDLDPMALSPKPAAEFIAPGRLLRGPQNRPPDAPAADVPAADVPSADVPAAGATSQESVKP